MVDNLTLRLKAGNGGDGVIAFERRKGRPYGPPVGGDGGFGGSVYIEATDDLFDLEHLRFKKMFSALPGERGGENRKKGKDGGDLLIKVPLGTAILATKISYLKDGLTSVSSKQNFDFVKDGERVLLVKGGRGGMGNAKLSAKLQGKLSGEARFEVFRKSEKGRLGEEAEVSLELKIIADIGIIGFPNVGKSSLLSVLTHAMPKIANYPFTTLEPNLGVLETDGRRLILADIPGLIEGASKGRGLGDEFLRHVERVRGLIHIIAPDEKDLTLLTEGKDEVKLEQKLWGNYKALRQELGLYRDRGKELLAKSEIVILNKVDLLSGAVVKTIVKHFSKHKLRVICVSATRGDGEGELIKGLASL